LAELYQRSAKLVCTRQTTGGAYWVKIYIFFKLYQPFLHTLKTGMKSLSCISFLFKLANFSTSILRSSIGGWREKRGTENYVHCKFLLLSSGFGWDGWAGQRN